MSVLQRVHDVLAKGGLEKGWGGLVCYQAVPLSIHIIESLCWVLVCFVFKHLLGGDEWLQELKLNISKALIKYDQNHPSGNPYRLFELIIGTLQLTMFLQLVYYKFNISALIYLLQPCHVILLIQGIALLNDGVLSVLITLFVLPSLTGTLLAMLFPETTGLDQPLEVESYWLQHYLIQSVPLYLLLRRNALALQFSDYRTVIAGLWILCIAHFSLLEVVDLSFMVNVDFILCPTSAMVEIFKLFPSWFFLPSYRTFMTFAVFVAGAIISYAYILPAKLIGALILAVEKVKTK